MAAIRFVQGELSSGSSKQLKQPVQVSSLHALAHSSPDQVIKRLSISLWSLFIMLISLLSPIRLRASPVLPFFDKDTCALEKL